jgi:hypothetical protein
LVLFRSSVGGTTDEQVEAKLVSMGQSHWDSLLTCSSEEMSIEDPMAPTLGMAVPIMLSPMHDLTKNDLSFYAKLGLDTQVEADTSNGWETMQQRASGSDATGFAKYAMRALSPLAMPDVCSDVCGDFIEAVSQQLKADRTLELCDAPGLSGLVACIVDEAMQRSAQCGKSTFMKTYEEDCLAGAGEAADGGGRLLADDDDEGAWDDSEEQLEGSEEHLRRAKKLALQKGKWQKSGSTKTSTLTKLEDGSFAIDISSLDAQQKAQVAEALGVRRLSAGRVLFNATDHEPKQKVDAILQAEQPDRVESRRLMLDMNCIAPGVGPGCIFSVGYPLRRV